MFDMSKIPLEMLEKEVAERKLQEERKARQVPKPLVNPDFTPLIDLCNTINKEIVEQKYDDDDNEHYIFEEVMNVIYGPTYWEWRKRIFK